MLTQAITNPYSMRIQTKRWAPAIVNVMIMVHIALSKMMTTRGR